MSGFELDRLAEKLFHELVDLTPEEMERRLDEIAKGNPALGSRLEALLRPTAAGVEALLPSDGLPVPQIVGPYRVSHKIGEGGMAEVYLATQTEPVVRTVALKLIKPGMGSREVLARFTAERQALAILDHPFVAKIFDAGTWADGRPYFAMEYADGMPITEHSDRERLDLRRRLHLFLQVCDAVQHAHQKGVIHRDIKPSNVLVVSGGEAPIVKVIDFGIAKATDSRFAGETTLTTEGQFVGTPEYMSPEQAIGDPKALDTRTDVYSLGVLLYELLAGVLPFESERLRTGAMRDMQRILCEEDPPRPSARLETLGGRSGQITSRRGTTLSSLRRSIRGDLDWIVLKALEKAPDRRYPGPGEFAADIRRHLADEPVAAGPPSTMYRFAKFVRRHRAFVAATVVTFTILVTATVVSIEFARREKSQRVLAEKAEDAASKREVEAIEAKDDLELVVQFQESMLQDIDKQDFGRALLDHIRDGASRSADRSSVPTAQRRKDRADLDRLLEVVNPIDLAGNVLDQQILARAAAEAEARFGNRRLLEAQLRLAIGRTYRALDLQPKAIEQFEIALAIQREHLGDESHLTQDTAGTLAHMCVAVSSHDRAAELLTEVLDWRRRALGEDHPSTLGARLLILTIALFHDDLENGLKLGEDLVSDSRRSLGADHQVTLEACAIYGSFLQAAGRSPEAIEQLDLALAGTVKKRGADDPRAIRLLTMASDAYADDFEFERALALGREAVERAGRVYGDENPSTLSLTYSLANLEIDQGAIVEGIDRLKAALRSAVRLYGARSEFAQILGDRLGQHLIHAGRTEEALPILVEAGVAQWLDASSSDIVQRYYEGSFILQHGDTSYAASIWRDLARHLEDPTIPEASRLDIQVLEPQLLVAQGRLEDAETLARNLLDRCRKSIGPGHTVTLYVWSTLGSILIDTEQWDLAAREMEACVQQFRSEPTESALAVEALLLTLLGRAEIRLGNLERARELFTTASERALAHGGERSLAYASVLLDFAELPLAEGRESEAEIGIRKGLARLGVHQARLYPPVVRAMGQLVAVLSETGRLDKAASLGRYTSDLTRRQPDYPVIIRVEVAEVLSDALRAAGRIDEAADVLRALQMELVDALGDGSYVVQRIRRRLDDLGR